MAVLKISCFGRDKVAQVGSQTAVVASPIHSRVGFPASQPKRNETGFKSGNFLRVVVLVLHLSWTYLQ